MNHFHRLPYGFRNITSNCFYVVARPEDEIQRKHKKDKGVTPMDAPLQPRFDTPFPIIMPEDYNMDQFDITEDQDVRDLIQKYL